MFPGEIPSNPNRLLHRLRGHATRLFVGRERIIASEVGGFFLCCSQAVCFLFDENSDCNIYIIYTSSSRASRWRKFQKKKELYSKERICL